MSNVFPPMISSSPPPIDVQDDDDEDTFGDFRVADLALNLTDYSVGRCSPETATILPSPIEKISIPPSPLLTPTKIPNGLSDIVPPPNNSDTDSEDEFSFKLTNGDIDIDIEVNDAECPPKLPPFVNYSDDSEILEEPKPPDEGDDSGVDEEIHSIPPSHVVYCPSVSPPIEHEARTSPEGADSDSECVDFKNLENLHDRQICSSDAGSINSEEKDISAVCESTNYLNEPRTSAVGDSDDFDDFADFKSQTFPTVITPQSSVEVPKTEIDLKADDFDDDFDDFESAAPTTTSNDTVVTDIASRVCSLFPALQDELSEDCSVTSCLHACLDDSSSVWGNLKDLETSNALTLQWSTSNASKRLLSSLNVDSRNVLLGPRWNTSVPRFAANLGCQPLEPKKADVSTSVAPPVSRIHPITDEVVPAAQFDWNSSGLTNPLDCLGKEEAPVSGSTNPQSSTMSSPDVSSTIPEQHLELSQANDVWSNSILPNTDILLPSPAEPSVETSIFSELNIGDTQSSVIEDLSIKTNTAVERESSWKKSNGNFEDLATWTISNSLSTDRTISKPNLSSEACRVVETLPDLSFLSARNLLLAANQNMARFKTESRL